MSTLVNRINKIFAMRMMVIVHKHNTGALKKVNTLICVQVQGPTLVFHFCCLFFYYWTLASLHLPLTTYASNFHSDDAVILQNHRI